MREPKRRRMRRATGCSASALSRGAPGCRSRPCGCTTGPACSSRLTWMGRPVTAGTGRASCCGPGRSSWCGELASRSLRWPRSSRGPGRPAAELLAACW